ncbi:DNA-binding HxlR family transcriptional regulator [Paenibacillus sp. V4I3]|uniref:winged helix-turn-helix transcriptional regulator n=1 Tax=unclassified Paenibacillus TaxID=185978 RepID=UPI002783888C|nr:MULTISPECIES: helix-turn-helix domain-containing protein [unclassified Paenibacillus]MDQ0878796.1 DNA-binding HxlR family transcriptional regulator [Paenibacillus sp. V4I3]MDQ0885352.1 DNA-binding HxlR family transcriptional regulator [Paenibacillus sp. V4I9]
MDQDFTNSNVVTDELDDECDINVMETLRVIGGKWKLSLLWQISEESKRFNELRRALPGISQKMLTQQLRELEEDGLLQRKVIPDKPPKVEYSLTKYGKTLDSLFDVMYDWGGHHRKIMSQNLQGNKVEKISGLNT